MSLCSLQAGTALRKIATSVFRLKRITYSAAEQQIVLPEHDVSYDLQTPTYQAIWRYSIVNNQNMVDKGPNCK